MIRPIVLVANLDILLTARNSHVWQTQRFFGIVLWQLIKQNNIEQRLMHRNTAIVIDKFESAKAIHKGTKQPSTLPAWLSNAIFAGLVYA